MNLETLAPFVAECPYPPELAYVDRGIRGRGFFPAANGFPNGSDPTGGILFLGRDWGTRIQYNGWVGEPARDETSSTSRNMRDIHLPLLQGLPVWCSNYLLGIRTTGSALDNVRDQIEPVAWTAFEDYCWKFLQRQIVLQRTKLLVVFGRYNRSDLKQASRLGSHASEFFQHTFRIGSDEHTTLVTYAPHPHSLIRREARVRAAEQVRRMREAYEQRGANQQRAL